MIAPGNVLFYFDEAVGVGCLVYYVLIDYRHSG